MTASLPEAPPVARVASIDAFRGFVMFLMLAEAMQLWTLHDAFPSSRFWAIVAYNTTHVPWQGCSLHDLIQPAFSFLVGASLPFSIANRRARGETFGRMLGHAVRRSAILILLGVSESDVPARSALRKVGQIMRVFEEAAAVAG